MDMPRHGCAMQAMGPYPGLRPFRHDETEIFFGREEQTDQLLEKLQRSRFIAVVGPSGCGKSSLVRAGMISALEAGFLADAGAGWRIADMRPGNQPIARLAEALHAPPSLGPELGADPSEVAVTQAMLRRGPLGLVEILRETRLPQSKNLLLLVDQFEEIFRFREQGNADDADAFVALLLASAAQREVPVYVVITMRSDFLGECALFLGLPEAINEGQYLTPRLTREQIQAAITGPAQVFGGKVEPALVNRLLNEIGPDPDQLPLLQHALMRMWARARERRQGNGPVEVSGRASPSLILTMTDYEEVGALSEALSSHADQVLANLTERQQEVVKVMMCRLTERGIGKRDIRHPARLDDIADVAKVPAEEVIEVAEQLRQQDRSFLTPPPPAPISAKTVLDIGHESLIRQWHKLSAWVEEEAASAATYRRLLQTAHLWADDKAALWGTRDLDGALKWRQERTPDQAWAKRYGTTEDFELATRFLKASEEHASWERELADQQREFRAKAQQRRYRLIWRASICMCLLVVAAVALATWALEQKDEAERQTVIAKDNAEMLSIAKKAADMASAEADGQRASALAEKAEADRQRALALAEKAEADRQRALALAGKAEAERQRARTETLSRVTRSREIATNALQTQGADPELGLLLALEAERVARTLQADGALQQAALTSKLRAKVDGKAERAVPLSNDRFAVLSKSREGWVVEVRSIESNQKPVVIKTQESLQPEFSPDGHVLAVMTQGGTLRLWEAGSWRSLPSIENLKNERSMIAFSNDSKYLAAGSKDGRLRVWETLTGLQIAVIGDENIDASSVIFSPDGMNLVTTHPRRNDVTLWRVASGERVRDIGNQDNPVHRVSFSPDGRQLLTTGRDNHVRIWSVENPGEVKVLTVPTQTSESTQGAEWVNKADFSPDGKSILMVSRVSYNRRPLPVGRHAWIWRTPFNNPQELLGDGERVRSASFSKDGHWIVSTGSDGAAKLRDASTLRVVGKFAGGSASGASISDDSRWLLTWSSEGAVRVWGPIDTGSGISLSNIPESHGSRRIIAPNQDYKSAISPNGKFLLAVGVDGYARTWDMATGALKAKLGDGEHATERAYFSPNGERVVTVGRDETARVWDVNSSKEIAIVKPNSGGILAADFSDDKHIWIRESGKIRLWNLDNNREISSIDIAGREVNCLSASPDGHWLAICSSPLLSRKKKSEDVIAVYDLHSARKPIELGGHIAAITDIFFSRDGKFAVSAGSDTMARIWEVGAWHAGSKLTYYDAGVIGALFDPHAKYLAAVDESNTVRVFSRETGRQASVSELRGHKARIRVLAFSSDGRWLVTGGDDPFVRVWDTKTGRAVAEFYGHTGEVIAVAFGKEPKAVITAGADGTIRTYRCAACVEASELISRSEKRLGSLGRKLSDSERARFLQ